MVTVERAKFEMKGSSYDPTKKPKKLGKKELEKVQRRKDKLLAWVPDQVQTFLTIQYNVLCSERMLKTRVATSLYSKCFIINVMETKNIKLLMYQTTFLLAKVPKAGKFNVLFINFVLDSRNAPEE